MFTRRSRPLGSVLGLAVAGVAAVAVVLPPAPASAQGLFNFFFGSPRRDVPRSANAYADPYPSFNPFGRQGHPPERRGESGPSAVYCVRLCDGRHFPIQRTSGANAVQLCNSFCPAATTKVFHGSGIDHASASDGTRYANLQNAFAYRDRIVQGCTCNGQDAYGLVTLNAEADPTLRNGDIVATSQGFVAYNGGRRQNAEFTPIENYPALSAEWRQRLSETRIVPANATPVPPQSPQGDASGGRDRRVHLDR